jgi:hypothetical protein
MTKEYAQKTYTEAKQNWEVARAKYESIKTWGNKKRDAAEEVEFWSNKMAFLQSAL